MEVAQRDHQQQAGGVADLRGGDDQRGQARAAVEVVGHQVQHRLGVVEVGDHGAGRHGDQGHQGRGSSCAAGGCGEGAAVVTRSG